MWWSDVEGAAQGLGHVVGGMVMLDKLEKVKTGQMDKPLTPVVMEQVWVTEK